MNNARLLQSVGDLIGRDEFGHDKPGGILVG